MPRPTSPSDPASSLLIDPVPFDADDARFVVARAEAELAARYGSLDDSERSLTAAMFDPPRGLFLVGRLGSAGPLIGGVGLRPLTETIGEIKRLWVDPLGRGDGIGRALMAALEAAAIGLGYRSLRLETGPKQPEAMALYDASGWTRQVGGWDGSACVGDDTIRFSKVLAQDSSDEGPAGPK